MFKSLGIITTALSSFSMPLYDNVVVDNGIKITYLYETNDVNTIDDLVVGNIYHLELERYTTSSNQFLLIDTYYNLDTGEWLEYSSDTNYKIPVIAFTSSNYTYLYTNFDAGSVGYRTNSSTGLDFVYRGNENFNLISLVSKCQNIPIKSVERVYPDTIFGNVSEFIDDYLLSGIPLIDSVSNSINGTNVTLRAWLNTTICISLAVLLLILLLLFIKWLFKLFAGLLSRS